MSVSAIITIITILIIGSMVISGISYSRQQAMEKLHRKINKYRQQADEVLSHISLLLKVDQEFNLLIQLQSLIVNALQSAYNLAPQDQTILDNLTVQKQHLQEFMSEQRDNETRNFFETENELSQSQLQLGQISKLLDLYRNNGQLSIEKSQTFNLHLKTLRLELTVNSHMHQAKFCGNNGDITMALMHIKQARDVVKNSYLDQEEKNNRVKSLTNLLNKAKKTNKIIIEDIEKPEKSFEKDDGKKSNF